MGIRTGQSSVVHPNFRGRSCILTRNSQIGFSSPLPWAAAWGLLDQLPEHPQEWDSSCKHESPQLTVWRGGSEGSPYSTAPGTRQRPTYTWVTPASKGSSWSPSFLRVGRATRVGASNPRIPGRVWGAWATGGRAEALRVPGAAWHRPGLSPPGLSSNFKASIIRCRSHGSRARGPGSGGGSAMIGVERANHARLGFPMWTRRATMLSVACASTFGGVVSPLGRGLSVDTPPL